MLQVAIHLSEFEPDCSEAIQGILTNSKHIDELHLIYPTYEDDATSMYAEWPHDKAKLGLADIKVFVEARMNAESLSDANVLIEIPPTCRLKLGALEDIHDQIKSASTNQTHFALATSTQVHGFSIWTGFLVVLTVIEWFWNHLFERNKLIQCTDVRGRFVLRKGEKLIVPEESQASWRFWNANVMRKRYAGDTCVLKGLDIFARLHNHRYLGLGLWVVPFFFVWFVSTFAWAPVVQNWSLWTSAYALTLWAIELSVAYLISGWYIRNRYNLLFAALFPLYFATFPFMLVYSKLLRK